jgi:hypothetical protein
MNGLGLETFLAPLQELSAAQITATLLLALALGVLAALTYRVSVPGRVLSPAMQSSLVLLCMVAAMVMMVIGNNLARAFSLVGALALVRFRTRLRSPWDISFVFFSLGLGIACGVFAYRVAIIGAVIVGLAVLVLAGIPLAGIRSDRIRGLRCDVAAFENVEAEMSRVMDRYLRRWWMIEARSLRFGELLSFRYRVVIRDPNEVAALLRDLGTVEGVERVILDVGDETGETE